MGGEDFDQQVVDDFMHKYNKENNVNIHKVGRAWVVFCSTDIMVGREYYEQAEARG